MHNCFFFSFEMVCWYDFKYNTCYSLCFFQFLSSLQSLQNSRERYILRYFFRFILLCLQSFRKSSNQFKICFNNINYYWLLHREELQISLSTENKVEINCSVWIGKIIIIVKWFYILFFFPSYLLLEETIMSQQVLREPTRILMNLYF